MTVLWFSAALYWYSSTFFSARVMKGKVSFLSFCFPWTWNPTKVSPYTLRNDFGPKGANTPLKSPPLHHYSHSGSAESVALLKGFVVKGSKQKIAKSCFPFENWQKKARLCTTGICTYTPQPYIKKRWSNIYGKWDWITAVSRKLICSNMDLISPNFKWIIYFRYRTWLTWSHVQTNGTCACPDQYSHCFGL